MEKKKWDGKWTVLFLKLGYKDDPDGKKAKSKKPKDDWETEIVAWVGRHTHDELMEPNKLIDLRKLNPMEGLLAALGAMAPEEAENMGKRPNTKDKGKARLYNGGASTIAFAWMDEKAPPTRFLIETAEKSGRWHELPVRWRDGEPK